jgi:hypothetical protein
MRRLLAWAVVLAMSLLVGLVIGAAAGWFNLYRKSQLPLGETVAMCWGDGKYGPGFYGARVYLVPAAEGYSVRACVYIGPGNDYWHDCGELGDVQSHEEAVAKWGKITWKDEGLYIGDGSPDDYFLPREKLEAHR